MVIKIGKASDNHFIIHHPHVSRYHAVLTREEDGSLFIEDKGSTNGTFVDGCQIRRKKVIPNDRITFGDEYTVTVAELLKHTNDYSQEFGLLKEVYDNYMKEKIRIQSSNQFKTRIFQTTPFAVLGVLGIVVGLLGKGNPALMVPSLIVAICAPTLGVYLGAKQAARAPKYLQDLANQFKIDYVCPKCGSFLGEIPWESLRNRKYCPLSSCKAKWSE
ncbi:MAG: FHA domain-containing protein [Tannerellaceae bacterium]|nr:FHA domain-containing protein [Tannerellaceae bacterium]